MGNVEVITNTTLSILDDAATVRAALEALPIFGNTSIATVTRTGTAGIKALDQLATTRQKKLRFDRSLIHAWGLFADQHISTNDFVIEYKGELVTTRECERSCISMPQTSCNIAVTRVFLSIKYSS